MTNPYRGSCLCSAIKFEVDEFLPDVSHCHCSMCRKFHGAAHATYASVSRSKFRWTEGEAARQEYTAENGTIRTFCKHCGSSLTFSTPKSSGKLIEVALGVMDANLPVRANAHIFVGSKANWTELSDDLLQCMEGPDSARTHL